MNKKFSSRVYLLTRLRRFLLHIVWQWILYLAWKIATESCQLSREASQKCSQSLLPVCRYLEHRFATKSHSQEGSNQACRISTHSTKAQRPASSWFTIIWRSLLARYIHFVTLTTRVLGFGVWGLGFGVW